MTDISVTSATPVSAQQFAGQSLPYIIDVGSMAAAPWAANASVGANALVRPTDSNETGYLYQSAAAGQTGPIEPAWTKSGTVSDGSINWTPVIPPVSGEDSIASVAWTQSSPPDSELTITGQVHTSLTATAFIGNGTYGNSYTIVAEVTMTSGAIYAIKIILAIV